VLDEESGLSWSALATTPNERLTRNSDAIGVGAAAASTNNSIGTYTFVLGNDRQQREAFLWRRMAGDVLSGARTIAQEGS
jgi:hypothetical protein